METKTKIRELIESMSFDERRILNEELTSINAATRQGVALEEITVDKLRNPEFSARVREEINAAIRGEI